MFKEIDQEIEIAERIMNDFARRTGLFQNEGNPKQRYLWTDAFAVQSFLALYSLTGKKIYVDCTRNLINHVHQTLGKFSENDSREGWISGLSEEEGENHPTISGLRIGKKRPERKENEPFNEQLEWERDGQYFHYHTRWISALLKAGDFLKEKDFEKYAAELSLAGEKFIHQEYGPTSMYWKMSIDLSRPLVSSMGAHDPLEGYLTALECSEVIDNDYDIKSYLDQLEKICRGKNWKTSDPLGIGGLLLNVVRAAELEKNRVLPDSVNPNSLLDDAFYGLENIRGHLNTSAPANYRLAFRECGLSLGLRVVDGYRDILTKYKLKPTMLDEALNLAKSIEKFWSVEKNRDSPTYKDHLDINEISLASSLLARSEPISYGAVHQK